MEKAEEMKNIEMAIADYVKSDEKTADEKSVAVLESIRCAMNANQRFIIPIESPESSLDVSEPEREKMDNNDEGAEELSIKVRTLESAQGDRAMVAFTSSDEVCKGKDTFTATLDIGEFLEYNLISPCFDGVVINPWGNSYFLTKNNIKSIFRVNLPEKNNNVLCFLTMDITQAETTCIVNVAKNSFSGGVHMYGANQRTDGPELLVESSSFQGNTTTASKITKISGLKAEFIIDTFIPVYDGYESSAQMLREGYWNSLELARKNKIHSIAFPTIATKDHENLLKDAVEIALKIVSDWAKINPDYGMAILFTCFDEKITDLYREIWDENQEDWAGYPIVMENNGRLEKAIQFAIEHHQEECGEDTGQPSFLHIIEVLQILSSMDADINLMIAGVLHNTLGNTEDTLGEIYEQFGVDVAMLVNMSFMKWKRL